MNIMIALPGGRYYALPREILERYAVPKDKFDSELTMKIQRNETVYPPDSGPMILGRNGPVALGIRG